MSPKQPINNPMARWFGLLTLNNTALVLAASGADAASKKRILKTNGACWAAAALHSSFNAHKKHQKEELAWANAAFQAGVAGVLLWKGFNKGSGKGA
jgi:hypothetical protein